MPTYEYGCEACGHQFDEFQKITDAPLVQCPKCEKPALKRGFGGGSASFRFVGQGFYITDYKKQNSAPCHKGPCGCKKES